MGRQGEKRQVGAARRRSRGHGLARLDGTRPRATVASKVMKSGETAGHGNGRRDVQTARKRSAQARSWKPGRRRQGCGRLANASPVRDERIANLEQRDPRSGDASMFFAYYLVTRDEFYVCSNLSNPQIRITITKDTLSDGK